MLLLQSSLQWALSKLYTMNSSITCFGFEAMNYEDASGHKKKLKYNIKNNFITNNKEGWTIEFFLSIYLRENNH